MGSVVNIAKDTLVGRPIKETLKENANSAIDNFKAKAENALREKSLKGRRSMKKIIILKKRNNNGKRDWLKLIIN